MLLLFYFNGADVWVLSLGWWLQGARPPGARREGAVFSSWAPTTGERRRLGFGGKFGGGLEVGAALKRFA